MIVDAIERRKVSRDKGYCLRSFNEVLAKLGLADWGGRADEAGSHIEARGYVQVSPQNARPGDVVVYLDSHSHYRPANGAGHIGILTWVDGKLHLFSNLAGKVSGKQSAHIFDVDRSGNSAVQIWRPGGGG